MGKKIYFSDLDIKLKVIVGFSFLQLAWLLTAICFIVYFYLFG